MIDCCVFLSKACAQKTAFLDIKRHSASFVLFSASTQPYAKATGRYSSCMRQKSCYESQTVTVSIHTDIDGHYFGSTFRPLLIVVLRTFADHHVSAFKNGLHLPLLRTVRTFAFKARCVDACVIVLVTLCALHHRGGSSASSEGDFTGELVWLRAWF